MTEQVKIRSVVTTVSPAAENPRETETGRETERQRDNANVKHIHSSEWDLIFSDPHLLMPSDKISKIHDFFFSAENFIAVQF